MTTASTQENQFNHNDIARQYPLYLTLTYSILLHIIWTTLKYEKVTFAIAGRNQKKSIDLWYLQVSIDGSIVQRSVILKAQNINIRSILQKLFSYMQMASITSLM